MLFLAPIALPYANSDFVRNFATEFPALCRRLYVIHAHPYFPYSTEADQEKAHKFLAAIKARFADESGVKFGAIHPKALGPHPMPQFQISFTKYHLVDVLPWLMFNRPEEFSILVHPFTAKPVTTLTTGASCQFLCQKLLMLSCSAAKVQHESNVCWHKHTHVYCSWHLNPTCMHLLQL